MEGVVAKTGRLEEVGSYSSAIVQPDFMGHSAKRIKEVSTMKRNVICALLILPLVLAIMLVVPTPQLQILKAKNIIFVVPRSRQDTVELRK